MAVFFNQKQQITNEQINRNQLLTALYQLLIKSLR